MLCTLGTQASCGRLTAAAAASAPQVCDSVFTPGTSTWTLNPESCTLKTAFITCRYFPTLDASSPYFQARPDNSTVPAASIAAMPQRPGAPEDAWLLQVASPFVPGVGISTGLPWPRQ